MKVFLLDLQHRLDVFDDPPEVVLDQGINLLAYNLLDPAPTVLHNGKKGSNGKNHSQNSEEKNLALQRSHVFPLLRKPEFTPQQKVGRQSI